MPNWPRQRSHRYIYNTSKFIPLWILKKLWKATNHTLSDTEENIKRRKDINFCDYKTGSIEAHVGGKGWRNPLNVQGRSFGKWILVSTSCIIPGHTGLSGSWLPCAVFGNNPLWDVTAHTKVWQSEKKVQFLGNRKKSEQLNRDFDLACWIDLKGVFNFHIWKVTWKVKKGTSSFCPEMLMLQSDMWRGNSLPLYPVLEESRSES